MLPSGSLDNSTDLGFSNRELLSDFPVCFRDRHFPNAENVFSFKLARPLLLPTAISPVKKPVGLILFRSSPPQVIGVNARTVAAIVGGLVSFRWGSPINSLAEKPGNVAPILALKRNPRPFVWARISERPLYALISFMFQQSIKERSGLSSWNEGFMGVSVALKSSVMLYAHSIARYFRMAIINTACHKISSAVVGEDITTSTKAKQHVS